MSTLNLSFFKKNPMGTEACSASLTTEFLDVFSETELGDKMLKVLGTIKSSVEVQVNCKVIDYNPVIECKSIPLLSAVSDNKFYAEKPKRAFVKEHESEPPTEAQVKYINDLATKDNLPVDVYLQILGHRQLSELNKKECISILKKVVDAP